MPLQYQGHTDHLMLSWNEAQSHILKFKASSGSIPLSGIPTILADTFFIPSSLSGEAGFSGKNSCGGHFPEDLNRPHYQVSSQFISEFFSRFSDMNSSKNGLSLACQGLIPGYLDFP